MLDTWTLTRQLTRNPDLRDRSRLDASASLERVSRRERCSQTGRMEIQAAQCHCDPSALFVRVDAMVDTQANDCAEIQNKILITRLFSWNVLSSWTWWLRNRSKILMACFISKGRVGALVVCGIGMKWSRVRGSGVKWSGAWLSLVCSLEGLWGRRHASLSFY